MKQIDIIDTQRFKFIYGLILVFGIDSGPADDFKSSGTLLGEQVDRTRSNSWHARHSITDQARNKETKGAEPSFFFHLSACSFAL